MSDSAAAALDRLREGNRHFVEGNAPRTNDARPNDLTAGQNPFAVILGCSDSRVPAEIVFDQGLGDLFVIRVAGNIVAPSQIGSIEFACASFGTPLVVVMGHTNCGAVTATIDELLQPTEDRSPNLKSIVDRIQPVVKPLLATELRNDRDALISQSVRANIYATVDRLKHGSGILETMVGEGKLVIVGAEYDLETGIVTFFDDESA